MFNFDTLQIDRVHHGALEEFHSGEMTFYQSLELEIGRFPVQEYHFNIDIFTILVEEIFQKVAHTLVGDMTTNDNVSDGNLERANRINKLVRSHI